MKIKNISTVVLNIVTALLILIIILMGGMIVEEVMDSLSSYKSDEGDFLYALENRRYEYMLDCYYDNCGSGDKEDTQLQEYYDIAKYYEAAFYHKIHEDAGDEARAGKYQAIMDEISERVGEFSFVLEDIDKTFDSYNLKE